MLASGRRVTASGNHPFLTLDGWVHLDDLHVGSPDRVVATRRAGRSIRCTDTIPREIWDYIERKSVARRTARCARTT